MAKSSSSARILLMALFLPVLLLPIATVEANNHQGIAGQQARELELNNWIDGNGEAIPPIRINELLGKVIYLYFFQDWCPGCHSRGFPMFKRLYEEFKNDPRVVLLAVQTTFEGHYTNTFDKLRENQLAYGIPVPMAHDAGTSGQRLPRTMELYRSGGTPWKVVINKQGKVVFNGFHIDPEKAIKAIRDMAEQ